jgi:limonene-1,2-epoxide hydrolase
MAVFHLECSIHRRCASGLSVATERLDAMTDAQAIAEAEARFIALLADRTGSATLWDDAGRIIWSTRRFIPGANHADAVADR